MKISVVIPAYNEQDSLPELVKQLSVILSKNDYEIIVVDDGSQDNTLSVLKNLHQKSSKIQYISLSRNFGHQYALKAGLDKASGDAVISMDADLQHPVSLIPEMIDKWQKGYDVVYTVRHDTKKISLLKRLTSKIFYRVFNFLTDLKMPAGSADFRLLDKKVIAVLRNMNEQSLFLRGIVFWLGFNSFAIHYQVQPRFAGSSSYNFKKMISLAIAGALSFGMKPVRLAVYLGLFTASMGCLFTCYVLYSKLFAHVAISGWASIMCVLLILGGTQLVVMGIIGEYIGRIFMETKKRPLYIVSETSMDNKNEK